MPTETIYYLPGANSHLETGLGKGLAARGFTVTGRATIGNFRRIRFQEQIELIASDLQSAFWTAESRVVCNSFGAYLFLHAQTQMPSYVGKVLLLSPILGAFENSERGSIFYPPRADRLMELARADLFPAPRSAEIHVGSDDWQSPPELVKEFGARIRCPVHVTPGRGHMLGEDYVGPLLDHWLKGDA